MFNIICLRSYIKHSIHGVPPWYETLLCSSEIIRYGSLLCLLCIWRNILSGVWEKIRWKILRNSQENMCLCSFNKQQGATAFFLDLAGLKSLEN